MAVFLLGRLHQDYLFTGTNEPFIPEKEGDAGCVTVLPPCHDTPIPKLAAAVQPWLV